MYIGCYNACDASKDPKYCCTGDYSSPQACQSNEYSTSLASRKYAILLTPIQVIINLQFIVAVGKQVEYKFAIWKIYLCRSFPYILHAPITFQKPSTHYMQRGLGLS